MTLEEACIQWGCLNGHTRKTSGAFMVARALHDEAAAKNPEEHVPSGSTPYRCYHCHTCSCGFGYQYDSSD